MFYVALRGRRCFVQRTPLRYSILLNISCPFTSTCSQGVFTRQWFSELTGCAKPCSRKSFAVTVRNAIPFAAGTRHGRENYIRVYLLYLSTHTTLYREYLLFDESAIVSAVGGSLGLFLGFSCWQAAKAAVRRAWPGGRKKKKRLLVNPAVFVKRV